MRLLGFVIFFNFDIINLRKSISTYIDIVDKLVIWRNSNLMSELEILNVFSCDYKEKIVVLGDGENLFIAGALNAAINYAYMNGYTHILTMDQDSLFESFSAIKYRETIERMANNEEVIFCPFIVSTKGLNFEKIIEGNLEKVNKNITSGSIYPLKIIEKLGKFREDLKIDYVDFEYSFRARKFGIDIYRINDVILLQEYGNIVKRMVGYTIGYSPLRLFFQTRNRIIVHNEYRCFELSDLAPSLLSYVKLMFQIVLFEGDKIKKVKAILLGILCGNLSKSKIDKWIIKNKFYM